MRRKRSPFLIFLCCVLAVPTCGMLIGDLRVPSDAAANPEALWVLLQPWLSVGVLLGLAHLLIRPILRLLSAPLGCLTLGLFGFAIDVALIYGCAYCVVEFTISGGFYAILTALLINCICAIISAD